MSGNSVSQKWLIGILTTLVLGGGAGWMTYVQGEVRNVREKQEKQQEAVARTQTDVAIIREKSERLEKDVKEIKEDQRDMGKKLDELLRRVR